MPETENELEIEIAEWCDRRIAEAKIDNGYYQKVKELMEEKKKLVESMKI